MTTWTLTPGWDKPPMSLNRRMHWATAAQMTRTIRTAAKILAREAAIPPLRHATVCMTWTVPDRRRRDDDNPTPTTKPFWDGLVDAGVVPDDTPEWMTKLPTVIRYEKGRTGLRFTIDGEQVSS